MSTRAIYWFLVKSDKIIRTPTTHSDADAGNEQNNGKHFLQFRLLPTAWQPVMILCYSTAQTVHCTVHRWFSKQRNHAPWWCMRVTVSPPPPLLMSCSFLFGDIERNARVCAASRHKDTELNSDNLTLTNYVLLRVQRSVCIVNSECTVHTRGAMRKSMSHSEDT